MKCFHHTDHDGKCAAYLVHKRFPKTMGPEDFIMIDYGTEGDFLSKIEKDEVVIIVDFSFQPEDMREILKKTNNVIWIDHHISSIKKYEGFETEIKGLRYDGVSGCMLTYCFFFLMNDGRDEFKPKEMTLKAPWFVKFVDDHDVWKHEYEESKYFYLGLLAEGENLPFDPIWERLNHDHATTEDIIKNGKVIAKFRDASGLRVCKMYGFEYEFSGHKAFCLNNVFGGSEWFVDLVKEYDIVCCFHYMGKDKLWKYSLYSQNPNVDCSVIVKEVFGDKAGGHKGAAGGTSDKCIFVDR